MDINVILKKACLTLDNDPKGIIIKSKFFLFDRGNLGLLFFIIISVFLFYISIFYSEDLIARIFLGILSLIIFSFTTLVIYKQLNDFLKINQRTLKFSNGLKTVEILAKSNFKIKVKSEIIHVKTRRLSSGSYFCVVELFLKNNDKKYRILDFQVDKKDAKEGKALGKEIKRMILEITNKV